MVVASTQFSSCLLLEPSSLYPLDEIYYDECDESESDVELVNQDTYCTKCSCSRFERIDHSIIHSAHDDGTDYTVNSLCRCGHSMEAHGIEYDMFSPSDGVQIEFAAFVPYESVMAAYKEAVQRDPNKGNPDAIQKNEVYSNVLYIPPEGGSYEFEYRNELLNIASVYDSSIPLVNSPFSTRLFKTVNSLSYSGPYYRISCDRGNSTWKIVVDPMLQTFKPETRRIYVLMSIPSQYYKFVFHFEQSNY